MPVKTLCALLLSAALAGCSAIVTETAVDAQVPGQAWNAPVPAVTETTDRNWWEQWNDPQLTSLLAQAQANNTDVRTALANLRSAAAASDIATADLFPTLAASGSAGRDWR